ncbi:MAG TPA: hypothetical protein VHO23_00865 [Candidatus Paceibacterota bacterium]|nr:hypothetical protein [Candidatus Paceibacterota bacterium]
MSGHGPSSPIPLFDALEGLLHGAHDKQGVHLQVKPIFFTALAALIAFAVIAPKQTFYNFQLLIFLMPVWASIMLAKLAIARWVEANRMAYISRQEHVLLEIRMPRDTRKSPLAMETVLTNLHLSPGESTWWKKYVNGAVRPWFSLEIVSLGGRVHWYVWTRAGFRRAVEAAFYSQYPDIEIVEAMDYSLLYDPSHHPNKMWGCEYEFSKPDPYPIKTYANYMDPAQPLNKPEETIDPMAQVIEFLASMGPKEQFWIQIMIRVSKKEKFGGEKSWKDIAQDEILKLRDNAIRKVKRFDAATGALIEEDGFGPLTRGQQDDINAIEKNVAKPGFDVGIRALYTAPEDAFQGSTITNVVALWKPINSDGHNSLGVTRWDAIFNDWPWEDPGGHHKEHLEHQLVDAYRRRSYFHEPYRMPWMIMSTEELATIFHVPSASVRVPSIGRIESATAEAPGNLPT